jgi:hypothetical protein
MAGLCSDLPVLNPLKLRFFHDRTWSCQSQHTGCGERNAHPFDALTSGMKATAGSIPSDDEFYELTAVTHDGTEWRAMKIWPAFSWDMRNHSVLATGRLQSIVAYLDRPLEHPYLCLHFFEE